MDTVAKRKNPCPYRESNTIRPVRSLQALNESDRDKRMELRDWYFIIHEAYPEFYGTVL